MAFPIIFLTVFLLGGAELAAADLVRAAPATGFAAAASVAPPPPPPTPVSPGFFPISFRRFLSTYELLVLIPVEYKLPFQANAELGALYNTSWGDGRVRSTKLKSATCEKSLGFTHELHCHAKGSFRPFSSLFPRVHRHVSPTQWHQFVLGNSFLRFFVCVCVHTVGC